MIAAKTHGRGPAGRRRAYVVQRLGVRLLIAGGLAVVALLVTQAWMESRAGAASEPAARVEVLVTARAIAAGSVIAPADLRWQTWPAELVAADWLLKSSADTAIAGRVVPVLLAAGVPITRSMAVMPGPGSSFAATIRRGFRAISIAVTPAGGLAGFVEPGDRVDVLLTQSIGNRRTVQALLNDIGVLGVDQRGRGGASMPIEAAGDIVADAALEGGTAPAELVTLEVTPRQGQALAVAAELGRLSLVLRGPVPEAGPVGARRWDSDVTGLLPVKEAPDSTVASTSLPAVVPTVPAPARAGVAIVYGVQPPEPALPQPAPQGRPVPAQ